MEEETEETRKEKEKEKPTPKPSQPPEKPVLVRYASSYHGNPSCNCNNTLRASRAYNSTPRITSLDNNQSSYHSNHYRPYSTFQYNKYHDTDRQFRAPGYYDTDVHSQCLSPRDMTSQCAYTPRDMTSQHAYTPRDVTSEHVYTPRDMTSQHVFCGRCCQRGANSGLSQDTVTNNSDLSDTQIFVTDK